MQRWNCRFLAKEYIGLGFNENIGVEETRCGGECGKGEDFGSGQGRAETLSPLTFDLV